MSEAAYYCDLCGDERSDPVCPICGLSTVPLEEMEVSAETPDDSIEKTLPALPDEPLDLRDAAIPDRDDEENRNDEEGRDEGERQDSLLTFISDIVDDPDEAADEERARDDDARATDADSKAPPPPPPRTPDGAIQLPASMPRQRQPEPKAPSQTPTGEFRASQREISEYLEEGFEIFLIAGLAGAGKTELLEAYKQGRFLGEVVRRDGRAMPTAPGDFFSHPFPVGKRKLLFVDASGEHFEKLYTDPSKGERIGSDDVHFLRLIAKHLRGLILLVNLERQWKGHGEKQEKMLRNVLILLRFLTGGGTYEAGARSFQDQVDAQLGRLPRLRLPVQVLLSKADQLSGLELPRRPDDAWLRPGGEEERRLYPPGEQPLLLVHHYLPHLLTDLERHVRVFRADFVHSLTSDGDSGAVTSHRGCGVELTCEWLIETSARNWRTMLPTRYLISTQAFFDRLLRRSLWNRLPPPRELGTSP